MVEREEFIELGSIVGPLCEAGACDGIHERSCAQDGYFPIIKDTKWLAAVLVQLCMFRMRKQVKLSAAI